MDSTLILNGEDVMNKVRRIAFEIRERYFGLNELVFLSIWGQGSVVADLIQSELMNICHIQILRVSAQLDKKKPDLKKIRFEGNANEIKGQTCIVIDDVINSGKTLMYVCSAIMPLQPKQVSVATIVDRFHRTHPIRPDFVGLTLSTNLKDNVSFKSDQTGFSVWLEG